MKSTFKRWTRDEIFILLNAYHRLNFGQFHHSNQLITALAERLGRTPSSVSMKLSNLASFDPALKLRGIKGLTGASALDGEVWDEFHADLPKSIIESEKKLRVLFDVSDEQEIEFSGSRGIVISNIPVEKTEINIEIKRRVGQNLFRDAILNNYDECCAVTQLNVRSLLVASHILPWATHPQHRLKIDNGICLSQLHDAAFDNGLITFDDQFRLMVSSALRNALPKNVIEDNFLVYEGQKLHFSCNAVCPSIDNLAFHRKFIYQQGI